MKLRLIPDLQSVHRTLNGDENGHLELICMLETYEKNPGDILHVISEICGPLIIDETTMQYHIVQWCIKDTKARLFRKVLGVERTCIQ